MDKFYNNSLNNEEKVSRKPKPDKPEHPGLPEHPEHPEHPNRLTVLINGEEKLLLPHVQRLSYEEIVKLAYGVLPTNPNTIYTVAYSNGPSENPKGTLTRGRSVMVKEGMVFNVSKSDKS
jgi:hypothetical protein